MGAKLLERQAAAALTFAAVACTVIGLFGWWLIIMFGAVAALVGMIALILLPVVAGLIAGRAAQLYRATALVMLVSLLGSFMVLRWAGLEGAAWAAVSPIPILAALLGVLISCWLRRLFGGKGTSPERTR